MSGIEVLDLVLEQIGELRIPLREEVLRQQIIAIRGNVAALREAMAENAEKTQETEGGVEDVRD